MALMQFPGFRPTPCCHILYLLDFPHIHFRAQLQMLRQPNFGDGLQGSQKTAISRKHGSQRFVVMTASVLVSMKAIRYSVSGGQVNHCLVL